MLEDIKMLLEMNDDSKDKVIQYHMKSVSQKILTYCNRLDLPKELENIVVDKVVNIMICNGEGEIKSISEGDTSVTYKDSSDNILDDVTSQLNRFRKVKII